MPVAEVNYSRTVGEQRVDDATSAIDQLLAGVDRVNDNWRVVSRRDRRTCEIIVVDPGAAHGEEQLVVKRFFELTSDLGVRSLEALDVASKALAELHVPGFSISVVEGQAATTEPPAVAMTFAAGSDLHEVLASAIPSDLHELRPVLDAAGRVLATLHDRWPRAQADHVAPAALLEPLRRQLRLRGANVSRFHRVVTPVPSMIDFAPNNLRVDDGALVVLDPPLRHRTVTRHEDLGHFVGQIRHHLLRNPALSSRDSTLLQRELADAFVEGYRAVAADPRWTSDDDDLVALFAAARSAVWAVKHWRRGQRRAAVRLGAVAVCARFSGRVRRRAFL